MVEIQPKDMKSLPVPHPNPVASLSALALPRGLFWELGGLDTKLIGWGGEDVELSFKVTCFISHRIGQRKTPRDLSCGCAAAASCPCPAPGWACSAGSASAAAAGRPTAGSQGRSSLGKGWARMKRLVTKKIEQPYFLEFTQTGRQLAGALQGPPVPVPDPTCPSA